MFLEGQLTSVSQRHSATPKVSNQLPGIQFLPSSHSEVDFYGVLSCGVWGCPHKLCTLSRGTLRGKTNQFLFRFSSSLWPCRALVSALWFLS